MPSAWIARRSSLPLPTCSPRGFDRQRSGRDFPIARTPNGSPASWACRSRLWMPIPMVGSIWRFAEYRPRPPCIVLYSRGWPAGAHAHRPPRRAIARPGNAAGRLHRPRTVSSPRSRSTRCAGGAPLPADPASNWQVALAHRHCRIDRDRRRRFRAVAARPALSSEGAGLRCRRRPSRR